MFKKKSKALVLFSGGLDSRLAVKILQQQKNLDVEAVFFLLPFGGGCCNNLSCVINYSQISGVKLYVVDFTKGKLFQEYLKIIKVPKHGTGTGLNPCRDCKIFMFKQAKKIAERVNADFLATGEVLSQRPMSQLKHQLIFTEKKAELTGKLLRPLSAKLLPETIAEKKGLVNRSKLLDLRGRQRKKQMKLAEKFKIKYPMPGGGCLLCEKEYCKKLKDLFKHNKKIKPEHIKLLLVGRHFRNRKTGKIILGRNEQENKIIEQLNKKLNYNIIIPKIPGPTAVYQDYKDKKLTKSLVKAYSKNYKFDKSKFENLKIN